MIELDQSLFLVNFLYEISVSNKTMISFPIKFISRSIFSSRLSLLFRIALVRRFLFTELFSRKKIDPFPFQLHTIYSYSKCRLQTRRNIREQIHLDYWHHLLLVERHLVSWCQFKNKSPCPPISGRKLKNDEPFLGIDKTEIIAHVCSTISTALFRNPRTTPFFH